MASFSKSDLEFILKQIQIAEQHAAGADLLSLMPNKEVAFGLRTVDGSFNHLAPGQSYFGAADLLFPRLVPANFLNDADGDTFDANGPAPGGVVTNNDYGTPGNVADADPRTISNLISDQTANNPAAVAAAAANPGSAIVMSPGMDGLFGTADDRPVNFIPNIAPDEGLSAGFNSWMTFFGQFFDHGLDLVTKGGNGTIFIPLQPDDPLIPGADNILGTPDDLPVGQRFMVVTRATNLPGPDGVLGTPDDIQEHQNTTSPFVDQNQTYSSHPSHQVFLRAYQFNGAGDPVSTGRLITNRSLGADGRFDGAPGGDDTEIGGMATWAVVKAQARDLLGINLTDADVFDVPLVVADQYGNFIAGPNGFPMVMMKGLDGIGGTADDVAVEGNPSAPISLVNAVRTGHAFLNDLAHNAAPGTVFDTDGNPATPGTSVVQADGDAIAGNAIATDFAGRKVAYDNELLDAHYIAGDGRVNENIGLTTVHHIFHSEHNRLVQHTKDVALASNDLALLNAWLENPLPAGTTFPLSQPAIDALVWNGERLFQAAKLGTEMQYQHLVFEEFARTIQPNIDAFIDFNDTVNPAIVAEFAHTVYRFGHSMLTETIDRLDPNFVSSEIGLIQAFLNPLAFAASGPNAEAAAGAIVRGLTRQLGNEIDEFVTEALRNNLLGLPLDLPAINIARGRDTGVPTLNAARREFYAGTGDSQLKPYTSWADFVQHMKHPESLINFIAAYGTHSSILAAVTLADKRAAATLLVLGGAGEPADRLDFLNSAGAWASGANGVTTTGLDAIDLWIGGLAEEKMPFGGMLGSTFNFVFETQMEALQDGDRLYYLHRLAGTNFVAELENNSFAHLIMLNTDTTHLPGNVFLTPGLILEVDPTKQFNANVVNNPGPDGILGDDPLTPVDEGADDIATPNEDPLGGTALLPLVIRDNPATAGPDSNYLQYTGDQHVVLGGTAGNDILISSEGDDTLYGDGGNDRLEGGAGNDMIEGGAGDDIITDNGGDDVLKGEDGNDVIHGGNGLNLVIAGRGHDFIVTGEDSSEVMAGEGNDFILGSRLNVQMAGNEGNDWIEIGTQDGAPGDNFDPFGTDSVIGHDVFLGDGGFDEMIGEGGDDIFVGSAGPDKMKGMSGFDWATYKDMNVGVSADFFAGAFNEAPLPASVAATTATFAGTEGLSGSAFSDILRGDNETAATIVNAGFTGSVLTNISLVAGLQNFLNTTLGGTVTSFGAGNIMLGGDGSDIIEGRGGDDLIDGDKWLNVRISVRANADGTGAEIASFDSMTPLIPFMLNGTYNPGQLQIVRELMNGNGGFDTAAFSGNRADYTIGTNLAGVTTVTDTVGTDGIDRLINIERLQFADQSITLSGTNSNPSGLLTISDPTPTSGQVLTVSAAGVTDADNPGLGAITGPITYYWQVEQVAGSGIFLDIGTLAGVGPASAIGTSFTVTPDLVGFDLRVKAVYQDANGVLETVFSAPTTAVVAGITPPPAAPVPVESSTTSPGVHFIRSDLQFILDQIVIGERDAAGEDLLSLLPNSRSSHGLRTVTGIHNNLVAGQSGFGAADTIFPRLVPANFLNDADGDSFDANGPAPGGLVTNNDYGTPGHVADSDPRTISNLIVDQTANNPSAVAANGGAPSVMSPGMDGVFGTADDKPVFFIPNVAADAGLSAGFNSWMTFFGQFFDHGLDLLTKGGNGTVFIPLQPDDPLIPGADGILGTPDDLPPGQRFMVVTRATNQPGPDGVLGTVDDIQEHTNTTSPFVDQNQTYSSHPSHQVFLRAYEFNAAGEPVSTGRLITNRNLVDGVFGNGNDVEIGGMATWAVVKAQARDLLGINLTDIDVFDVPLLATDDYGNFLRGPNGFPQIVLKPVHVGGPLDPDGDGLAEGSPLAPIDASFAVSTGHAFLNDLAHNAVPGTVFDTDGNPATPGTSVVQADGDAIAGNAIATDFAGRKVAYDNELLDAHYIAGDGRVNENIGLTAVHAIFHSEHNRLVQHTKDVAIASNDVNFLNQWLLNPVAAIPADLSTLVWNGERLFQAAKLGTEMQYQHLVFEEFARTIQPGIDIFTGPTQGYDANINPAIVAEFAHTVYRFGHSMLTETIDRLDPNYVSSEIGLIEAFLNPLAFAASGPDPEAAAGAIVRGVTRQLGNEIDEFVTEALRNNLLGLPLDLPAINIARGRDTGVPTLNAARREFFNMTGDSQLKPYTSWADFVQYMKHPESLINFIAAYGTHSSILAAVTLADKRAAATLLVLGGAGEPADRLAFLNSTDAYASLPNGVTTTGLDAIDLWIGGLAEEKMPFGGMLGSTFNFVFETQMEALQNGDRFYYLDRLAGSNFVTELENSSFAKLIMANTDATHLPGVVFLTPGLILEVDPSRQFNASVFNNPGPDGILGDDPLTPVDESADDIATPTQDPLGGTALMPLVIRDNPATAGPDANYLQYTGVDHVVLGGTSPGNAANASGNDILIGSIGDDTLYGDGGNDRLEGGDGNDMMEGGAGDDIITDTGGDDVIKGDDGNDVIQGGNGINLILGGFGQDFIITGEDSSEAFGGPGDDFILGANANEQDMGNEGDDWLEQGNLDGNPGDNFDPFGLDTIIGNDVYIGSGQPDIMNAEGGDDIMVGSGGPGDSYLGASGFDWATFKDDQVGVNIDLNVRAFNAAPGPVAAGILARFAQVEGLSGSAHSDVLRGDNIDAITILTAGAQGSVLTNIGLINGLQAALGAGVTSFGSGNIILGGDGSDVIEGRGGDDIIDGDKWLNVRISVRANADGTGAEIATFDSMVPMVPLMLNGTYNPGQLQIVREIMEGSGAFNFDTAVFSENRANYTIEGWDGTVFAADTNGDGFITVTHDLLDAAGNVIGVGIDGVDKLAHIERLQFGDFSYALAPGNADPVGLLRINDGSPIVGQVLTVSAALVADADNPGTGAITGPISYFWQFEPIPGTGAFQDIIIATGVGTEQVIGPNFTVTADLVGFALRARAVYLDAHGVLENVFSTPTLPTALTGTPNVLPGGAVLIDDATPTEGQFLIASNTITDANGTTNSVFSYQWQVSIGGGLFTNIAGAVDQFFAPTQAQVNQQIRVVATFIDDGGTLESVTSAPTGGVGDLMIGTAGADELIGTAFDDELRGLAGGDTLRGLAGSDLLFGGENNDVLFGGAGNDIMAGGSGNDTYEVTEAGDVVQENAGEGTDTVWAYLNYTLGANVENLVLSGSPGNLTGTGNALNNLIVGGSGNNVLVGGGGNDTMQGGLGNDTYEVRQTGDVVQENAGAGIDTVWAYVNYTLSANVENLVLSGSTGNLTGTGNALNNLLVGGSGNNVLTGGAGADTMQGGLGNDTYEVREAGDVVQENAGAGTDTVWAYLNYTLGANVENLVLSGSPGNLTGTGNALNNLIVGGSGNNVLIGGGGADTMQGGLGNDTYEVREAGDVVQENAGAGTDTVWAYVNYTLSANVENLVFSGSPGDLTGTGNTLNNLMVGGNGANTLVGGLGADTLTGGIGADLFVLTGLGDSGVGAGARDIITDFVSGLDRIQFTAIDANTGVAGNQAFTMINTAAFSGVAGQLRYSAVGGNTIMEGDVNGDSAADFQVQLTGSHTFVAADLLL